MSNFWDDLMETDEGAADYMLTYGEGPGCETRQIISSLINDGESVLDVGAGPGWNYDHFREYGPKVDYAGVDYSERFVRIANDRLRSKYGESEHFVIAPAEKLPYGDDFYDVVLLQDVLDHTNGYEKPLAEALRVAKKRVIVVFWRGQMRDDFENDHGEDNIRDDGNDGFTGEYSRKKWEKYLDDLGYHWMETQTSPDANRWHIYYIIDKEEPK